MREIVVQKRPVCTRLLRQVKLTNPERPESQWLVHMVILLCHENQGVRVALHRPDGEGGSRLDAFVRRE